MKGLYQFGPYRLEIARRRLMRDGEVVPVSSRVFETLLVLVQNHQRVMVKDELMQAVWPDSFVEEVNLAQNISALRKALGEAPGENRYIATIPGRGYRFVADVEALQAEDSEIVVQRQTTATLVIEEDEEVKTPLVAEGEPGRTLTGTIVRSRKTRNLALLGALAIVIVAVGVFLWRGRQRAATTGLHTLAVLPFQPLSSPDDQYLGLGLTDAVITRLSKVRQLIVRPTSSVLRYADAKSDPLQAGRSLGVESVLDGTVQKVGDQLRVTVQLLDVKDGRPLWAETFDENFTNIFNVEDSISLKIAEALKVQLSPQEQQAVQRRYTQNVDAYDKFLRGKALVGEPDNPEKLDLARKNFEEALRLDPNYAPALAGLSWVEGEFYRNLDSDPSHLHRAEALAQKALAIDPQLSDVHVVLGLLAGYRYDYRRSVEEFKEARRLEPDNAPAWDYESWALAYQDPPDGASAEKATRESLRLGFSTLAAYYHLGRALLVQGRYDEAIAAFEHARTLGPTSSQPDFGIAQVYLAKKEYEHALQIFLRIPERQRNLPVPRFVASSIYAGLGEREKSLAELQKALDEGYRDFAAIEASPQLAAWRSDPRFQQLLRRYKQ